MIYFKAMLYSIHHLLVHAQIFLGNSSSRVLVSHHLNEILLHLLWAHGKWLNNTSCKTSQILSGKNTLNKVKKSQLRKSSNTAKWSELYK